MIHHLNFKHLRYFLIVAQEGSIARASERLNLTPQTISAQLKQLETALDVELFNRDGRRMELTDAGRKALSYAEEIFTMGEKLQEQLQNPDSAIKVFRVGIADVLPKVVATRLLEPFLKMEQPVRLVCLEGSMETLLADLTTHKIDLVLADRPANASFHIKAYNHLLGESGISVFAADELRQKYADNFPDSLDQAPFLLPTSDTVIGAGFIKWSHAQNISPNVTVECVDSALIGTFGQAGTGLFCGPTALSSAIEKQYDVHNIGELEGMTERFYAITLERLIRHPGVLAITNTARSVLFESQ